MTVDDAFKLWASEYFKIDVALISQVSIQVSPIAMRCDLTNGDVLIFAEGIYPTITQMIAPIVAAYYVPE